MRYPLQTAIIGSTLILLTHACGKRDQYDRGQVPANPDRADAALVSTAGTPGPAANPALGEPNNTTLPGGVSGNALPTNLSPADIVARVSEWNSRPIVWNESVGNIKIGETNWDEWYNEFETFRREGRVNYGFVNFYNGNQLCDYVDKNGSNVCTSISGVVIYDSYEGKMSLPREDGSSVEVGMKGRLDLTVFSKADREGTLIEGTGINNSTRGREFFKRFYRTFIAPGYTDEKDVDCFAIGRCNYQLEAGYYAWVYSAPGGIEGFIFVTRDENRLHQIKFVRSNSTPIPKALYTEGSQVDLLDGSIKLPNVAGGVNFNLGDTYEQFAKMGLPPATWGAFAGSNQISYSGISFDFKKSKQERLTDLTYSSPEASDPGTFMLIDQDFDTAITKLSFAGRELSILNQAREKWTKKQHIDALEKLRVVAELKILANQGELLVSHIQGQDQQANERTGLVLSMIYRLKGKTYHFAYATYLGLARAMASLQVDRPFESELLEVKKEGNRVTGLGSLTIGNQIALEDLDLDVTSRATVTFGDTKVRVALARRVKTLVSRPGEINNLPDLYAYYDALRFSFGSTAVDVVPCKVIKNSAFNDGYCIIALYATDFFETSKMKSFGINLKEVYRKFVNTAAGQEKLLEDRRALGELRASIPTCQGGSEIFIDDKKEVALAKLKREQCLLLTESTESSDAEKTSFYIYETSSNFVLGAENNGFVTGFQFY